MDYSKETIENIRAQREHVLQELNSYKQILSEIDDEILSRYKDKIAELSSDEMTGTVRTDGVKFTIPKTVTWDQDMLAGLYDEIGDTAGEYIDVKYSVKESSYKSWPSNIKDSFTPARTVKPGKPRIEFLD